MRDDLVPLLDRHLEAFRAREFVYGRSDCVTFAVRWLKRCGIHAPEPVYDSLHEGARFLVALGVPDTAAAADRILSRREVIRARIGDIVAHKDNGALGICIGNARAAFLNIDRGFGLRSLNQCAAAWSVEPCLR